MGFLFLFVGCSKDSLETKDTLPPNQTPEISAFQSNPDISSVAGPLGSPNSSCECTWTVTDADVDGIWGVEELYTNGTTTGSVVEGDDDTWLDDSFNYVALPSPVFPIVGKKMRVAFGGNGNITLRYRCVLNNGNGTYSVPIGGIKRVTYSHTNGVNSSTQTHVIPSRTNQCSFSGVVDN